jgi:hypothetical protein
VWVFFAIGKTMVQSMRQHPANRSTLKRKTPQHPYRDFEPPWGAIASMSKEAVKSKGNSYTHRQIVEDK